MIERALLDYFANSLWQVPLLAAAAWFLVRMTRPRVATQHVVWLIVLGVSVVLPLRGSFNSERGTPAANTETGVRRTDAAVTGHVPAASSGADLAHARVPERTRWLPLRPLRITPLTTRCMVALYLATVGLALLRLVRAWAANRRMVSSARPTTFSPAGAASFEDCCQLLEVHRPVLLFSDQVQSPVVVGVLRPSLLLPHDFARYTDYEATAVLCHELAHVKRRDYLVNLICHVAGSPVAYHPAAAFLQQRISQTREMICDEVASGGMPLRYAKCLLALAQRMAAPDGLAKGLHAMGLFDRNGLEERVMRLMNSKREADLGAATAAGLSAPSAGRRAIRVVSGAAAMMAVISVAAVFHVRPTLADSRATSVAQKSAQETPTVVSQSGESADPVPVPQSVSGAAAQPSVATHPGAAAKTEPATHPEPSPGSPDENPTFPRESTNGKDVVIVNGVRRDLTSAERKRIDKQISSARAQLEAAAKRLDSPEFKQQMADAMRTLNEAQLSRQMDAVSRRLNDPEFKKQLEDAERKMNAAALRLDSLEFTKQRKEALKALDNAAIKERMDAASRIMDDPALSQLTAEAQRQVANATAKIDRAAIEKQLARSLDILNDPKFKKQMEDAQRAVAQATAQIDSAEFRHSIDEMEKRLESGDIQREMDAAAKAVRDAEESLLKLQSK